jgi:amino acid transporter
MPALASAAPRPTLSLLDIVAIIVGIVIGAGIFETPPLIAANSSGPAAMLLAWVAGGAITVVGALCYAELATAYPDPGGNYVSAACVRRATRVPARVVAPCRHPDRVHRDAELHLR